MPKALKIITAPDKILTSPTKLVKKFDKKLKDLVERMIETLKVQDDPPGVGLAANQVGYNLSLFILWPDPKKEPLVVINPKIIKKEERKQKKDKQEKQELEGCLSIPKIWGPVKRAEKILLEYQDIEGKKHQRWFTGLEAIIVQHEVDHLNGILFTTRALKQGNPLFKEEGGELKEIEI